MQRLDFNISDQTILSFDVDHKTKTARLVETSDELAAHVLLSPDERTYTGIERRLNEFQQTDKPLAKHLADIENDGFHAPMQQNLNINNSENAIKETQNPIDAPIIELPSNFGNTNINGLQQKDNIQIEDQAYFVKLDSLSPSINGSWDHNFDSQYSSVSEAITSILLKNIKNADQLNSVLYEWREFEINGKKVTGTISKNFLQENEEEHVLSIQNGSDKYTHITLNEYEENMYDVNSETRLKNLVNTFESANIDKKTSLKFLTQQAAFDLLTGNQDRLNNPSNFVFTYNTQDQTSKLINLDYGRSLPMFWTITAETNYDIKEFLAEDIPDFAEEMNRTNNSILSGMQKSHIMDFLNNNGFEQFEINVQQLHTDLAELKERILASDAPYKKFAEAKIESFKEMLNSDFSKNFYKEITIEKPEPIAFKKFDVVLGYIPSQDSLEGNYLSHESQLEENQTNGEYRPLVILAEKNGKYIAVQGRSAEKQEEWPHYYVLQNSKEAGLVEKTTLTTNIEQILYIEPEALQEMVPLGHLSQNDKDTFLKEFAKENHVQKQIQRYHAEQLKEKDNGLEP